MFPGSLLSPSSQSVARLNNQWSNDVKMGPRGGGRGRGRGGFGGRDDLEATRRYRDQADTGGDKYGMVFDVPDDRRKRSRSPRHRPRERSNDRSRRSRSPHYHRHRDDRERERRRTLAPVVMSTVIFEFHHARGAQGGRESQTSPHTASGSQVAQRSVRMWKQSQTTFVDRGKRT